MHIIDLRYALLKEFRRQEPNQPPTARQIDDVAQLLLDLGVDLTEQAIACAVAGWCSARGL